MKTYTMAPAPQSNPEGRLDGSWIVRAGPNPKWGKILARFSTDGRDQAEAWIARRVAQNRNRMLDLPVVKTGLTLRVGFFPEEDELILASGIGKGKGWRELPHALVLPASQLGALIEILNTLNTGG